MYWVRTQSEQCVMVKVTYPSASTGNCPMGSASPEFWMLMRVPAGNTSVPMKYLMVDS